jgi:hypothetical protein
LRGSPETEHGVTTFEIETIANGKHRDVGVDGKGNVTTIEEETAIGAKASHPGIGEIGKTV